MTKDELLLNAKYIQFPDNNEVYFNYSKYNKNINFLPLIEHSMYEGMTNNSHHYTTEYHYNYVLPMLARILHFDYDKSDFTLKKNIIEDNDHTFDLSYYVSKYPYTYTVYGYENNEIISCDYKYLVNSCRKDLDHYHNLYVLSHSCSRIVNNSLHNGRKLFISGDSQMIPCIAPLTCYFEEVWYFDNRTGKKYDNEKKKMVMDKNKAISFEVYYKDVKFSEILIELFKNPFEWYTDINLQ